MGSRKMDFTEAFLARKGLGKRTAYGSFYKTLLGMSSEFSETSERDQQASVHRLINYVRNTAFIAHFSIISRNTITRKPLFDGPLNAADKTYAFEGCHAATQ